MRPLTFFLYSDTFTQTADGCLLFELNEMMGIL